jgi:hypothetical protein
MASINPCQMASPLIILFSNNTFHIYISNRKLPSKIQIPHFKMLLEALKTSLKLGILSIMRSFFKFVALHAHIASYLVN